MNIAKRFSPKYCLKRTVLPSGRARLGMSPVGRAKLGYFEFFNCHDIFYFQFKSVI
jgi:hypothetical protein